MEILTYLLIQFILIFVLVFASIGDIKERKLLPVIPLALVLIISFPVTNQICGIYEGIGIHIGINAIITLAVTACLYALNITRSRKGKKRLVGGGDIITYAVISLAAPIGYPGVWLIPASIVIVALAGFIPPVEKSHENRGIPYILYLTIAYAIAFVLQTAALYVI